MMKNTVNNKNRITRSLQFLGVLPAVFAIVLVMIGAVKAQAAGSVSV